MRWVLRTQLTFKFLTKTSISPWRPKRMENVKNFTFMVRWFIFRLLLICYEWSYLCLSWSKYIKEENIPPLLFWQDSGVAWTCSRRKSGNFEASETQPAFFAIFFATLFTSFQYILLFYNVVRIANMRQKKMIQMHTVKGSEMQCKNIKASFKGN